MKPLYMCVRVCVSPTPMTHKRYPVCSIEWLISGRASGCRHQTKTDLPAPPFPGVVVDAAVASIGHSSDDCGGGVGLFTYIFASDSFIELQ